MEVDGAKRKNKTKKTQRKGLGPKGLKGRVGRSGVSKKRSGK